ncbi:hypothetical protein CR513_48221, partial [Mucuna pruriens]
MAKAVCQKGPWSVRVSPCRIGETVNIGSSTEGRLFFYLYDTFHSKLGIRLPFSHFERAVLQALNVAPTQLHPNGWAYVRAFELLCEDLGRAPSLGVFFWFYTVKKTEKVGWMSLCSRPKRKLFIPFLQSYKKFKTQFFKVTPGDVGPNLLMDREGRPFFPLQWTHQPAVSITVNLDDLEGWEKSFARELSNLPLLPSAKIIKGDDCSSKVLRALKKKAAEKGKRPAILVEPLAATGLPSPQVAADADSETSSLMVVGDNAPEAVTEDVGEPINGSPLRFEDRPQEGEEEQACGVEEERPAKRRHVEESQAVDEPIAERVEVEGAINPSPCPQWDALLSGFPSTFPARGPPPLLGRAVDLGLTRAEVDKVQQLGVVGTCKMLQQHAAYTLIMARTVEREFGKLAHRSRSSEERAAKIEAEFLKLSKTYVEAEIKINSYRSATANLEEDLKRTVVKNKDLQLANCELDTAVGYANARADALQQKNDNLESSLVDLRKELASPDSSLKQASEDVMSRDNTIRRLEQTIEALNRKIEDQTRRIEDQEETVTKLGGDIVEQFEAGFAKALEQVRFLHPSVDVSEADPFKDLIDGQLVLAPSPPSSPSPE